MWTFHGRRSDAPQTVGRSTHACAMVAHAFRQRLRERRAWSAWRARPSVAPRARSASSSSSEVGAAASAASQAPAARQAAVVVVPTRRARGFAPATRALRQTDADTDDEFVTMTDVDVNRGSRLAQQVRANPPRCLRTRRVRRVRLQSPPPPPKRTHPFALSATEKNERTPRLVPTPDNNH